MNITMMTIGSTGDVRPLILLGKQLKQQGHTITIAAMNDFSDMIESAGLNFFSIAGDASDVMAHIMRPGAQGITYLHEVEKALKDIAPILFNNLIASCSKADACICTFFGRLFHTVAEYHHIPCIQVQYCPMDPNDVSPIPAIPGQHMGKLYNLASYRLGYFLISILQKKFMNPWRISLGLPPLKLQSRPDYDLGDHVIPVVYAISPIVMPRPKSWKEHIHMTGFWYDHDEISYQPPEDLQTFLDNGPKPIYIGFGSMVSGNMNKTIALMLRAIRIAKVRAVVSLGWAGKNLHLKSNGRVYFADSVPHDWLFPRVAAVVHHGGAGTTAAGLKAGKPTLVIPFGGDQPFWGDRVYRLGCGPKPLSRDRLSVKQLAKRLIELTTRNSYHVAAEEISLHLKEQSGVQIAANLILKQIAAWSKPLEGEHDES